MLNNELSKLTRRYYNLKYNYLKQYIEKEEERSWKNEWKDEKVAAIKLTRALHLSFIFCTFSSSYRIIIHLYRRNDSSEIMQINQLKFEIDQVWAIASLLLRENNSQQRSCDGSDLLYSGLRLILLIFNRNSRILKELFHRWINIRRRWRLIVTRG